MPDSNNNDFLKLDVAYIIINGLISIGLIILFFTMGIDNSYGGLVTTITGYSCIVVGFIILVSVLLNSINYDKNKGVFPYVYTFMPFAIIIASITYILYITGRYFNRIISGNVSNGYIMFTNIFFVLLLAQLGIVYGGTQEKKFKEEKTLPSSYSLLISLLGTIGFIVAITIGIILAYFSTDG
jgi:hypothetical protein